SPDLVLCRDAEANDERRHHHVVQGHIVRIAEQTADLDLDAIRFDVELALQIHVYRRTSEIEPDADRDPHHRHQPATRPNDIDQHDEDDHRLDEGLVEA